MTLPRGKSTAHKTPQYLVIATGHQTPIVKGKAFLLTFTNSAWIIGNGQIAKAIVTKVTTKASCHDSSACV